jgi:hypothetical protein
VTAPTPRSGPDPASVRGLAVLAVAVVLGFLLLGGSDELNISTTSQSGPDATTTSTTFTVPDQSSTTAPAAGDQPAKPPAEVKVIVLNGSGGVAKGVAGTSTEKLKELGYQTADPANAAAEETTVVYFADGFEGNAQAIKTALKLSGSVAPLTGIGGADVKDANVVVVLGADAAALVEGGGDGATTTSTTEG